MQYNKNKGSGGQIARYKAVEQEGLK